MPPMLSAQGESRAAISYPPVAAAASGTRTTDIGRKRSQPARAVVPRGVGGSAAARLPHTVGSVVFSWRGSLPLGGAAETQIDSLHWQQLVIMRYHTHNSKMNQKKFQLVTISCNISIMEINFSLFGLGSSGAATGIGHNTKSDK
jgi:hypothetical protein